MTNHVDPSRKQFGAMMKSGVTGPINMLNLVRLKTMASYDDGREVTGAKAYAAYGRESGPVFSSVGGRIIWSGVPQTVLIGPDDEYWHICFIAEYPDLDAFYTMVKNSDYQAAVKHRQAAVETSRLILTIPRPTGAGLFG